MSEYFIYYAESNIVCLIIFGILLFHDYFSLDQQEKQIKYDHALVAFMLYFFFDTCFAAVIDGVLPKTPVTMTAALMTVFVTMILITYCWLRYAMAVVKAPHRERRINKFAVLFPAMICLIAVILVFVFAPGTYLTEELDTKLDFNVTLAIVPLIYIAAILVYVLRKARVEEDPVEKRKQLLVGFFPLFVLAGGLFQVVVAPDTPVFCFFCAIMMLVLHIQSMETKISMDPLTGLNNRGQLQRYISSQGAGHGDSRLTYVVMIDINDFKAINDTYGHAEGDNALVIVAEALKKIVNTHPIGGFLARYGGDEFIMIVHPADREDMKQLDADIRMDIEDECTRRNAPYVLSVGVGYDDLRYKPDTIQKCMQRADKKLYADKEYTKAHGRGTVRI